MKYNCELIKDLLPLYQDGVCSESSRRTVEEHLEQCKECSDYLEALRSSGEIETTIDLEREEALSSQAKFFRRRSAVVGTVFAGIFMLPVLICLIVGLAVGGLSWVMIVLAAMLIPVSLVAVPLLAPENKALWTLGSFIVSLVLLFGVCSAISGSSWFFIAAPASLFGLSVVFSPFAVKAKPIASKIGSRKGLAVMALDTTLYILMMICIGVTSGAGIGYYNLCAAISLPILIWVWGLFLVIRYLKAGKAVKTAAALGISAVIMIISGLMFHVNDFSSAFYIETMGKRFEFSTYTATAVILIVIGGIFALAGLIKSIKRRKK